MLQAWSCLHKGEKQCRCPHSKAHSGTEFHSPMLSWGGPRGRLCVSWWYQRVKGEEVLHLSSLMTSKVKLNYLCMVIREEGPQGAPHYKHAIRGSKLLYFPYSLHLWKSLHEATNCNSVLSVSWHAILIATRQASCKCLKKSIIIVHCCGKKIIPSDLDSHCLVY